MGKKKKRVNGTNKGKNFEREIARDLQKVFPNARRWFEYHAADANGVDLQNTGRFRFQCKFTKDYVPLNTICEVQCDEQLGDVPVLVAKANDKRILATLPWEDFLTLLRKAEKPNRRKA